MKHGLPFPVKITLLALLLRLLPVLLTRGMGIGLDDMFQYDMLARGLASGNGYRWYALEDLRLLQPYVDFDLSQAGYDPGRGVKTSFRAPLYPAFLSVVYRVTGLGQERFLGARLVQAVLGALLAPLTFWAASGLFPRHAGVAVLSAWIVACYPMLVLYPLGLATENLFFPLLLASTCLLLQAQRRPGTAHFALCGLVLGLTALTRSVILPFAGLSLLWVWFVLREKRGALVMAAAMLALLVPWAARNTMLHGRLTGIESSLGYNLYLGYHPQGDGSFAFGPSLDLLKILDDAERDRIGIQQALEFIRAQPERVLPLALNRLGFFLGLEKRVLMYFYSNNLVGGLPPAVLVVMAVVMWLPFALVALSAMLGLGALRAGPATWLLLALLGAYTLPHALILAEDRFHLALVPFLAILAAHLWCGGWRELVERWLSRDGGRIQVSLAVVAAGLLLVNWALELARDAGRMAALLAPGGNQTYFPY